MEKEYNDNSLSELRKKQGERLKERIILKYGKFNDGRARTRQFCEDLESEMKISQSAITLIMKGEISIDSRVRAFSKFFKVREEYLLCIDDFPTEDDQKQSIIRQYWTQWHADASDRARVVKSVTALLEERSIQLIYDTKEGFQISKIEGQYSAYNANESYLLSEDQFYTWLDTFAVNIRISEDSWIHLNKVYVVAPDHNVIELTINDYMKMVYDINDEITHRIHSWFSLYSYNISNTWDQSFFEVDTKKTATEADQ